MTAVHKSNVLHVTEGLFLAEVRKIAQQHPGVAYEEQLVDSMAALLVRDAAHYDVVVTTNMFGDILSDEASELSGSLDLAASINAGDEHCMAQAQHGSAPDIAGQGVANPTGLLLSACMMLDHLEQRDAATRIRRAIDRVVRSGEARTRDMGGTTGTRAFTDAICRAL